MNCAVAYYFKGNFGVTAYVFHFTVAPDSVSLSAVKVANQRVKLTWSAPPDPLNKSCNISHYLVTATNVTGNSSILNTTEHTCFVIDSLTGGGVFIFSVEAVTLDGKIGHKAIAEINMNCK